MIRITNALRHRQYRSRLAGVVVNRPDALYTPLGIAAGTLLGSLAAGSALLWLNYRKLGHAALANKVGVAGLALYALIVVVASLLPNGLLVGAAFIVLQTAIAYWAAEALQGDAIRYHLEHGSRAHPTARAAGIGLLAGLGAVLVLVVVLNLLGLAPEPARG